MHCSEVDLRHILGVHAGTNLSVGSVARLDRDFLHRFCLDYG